MIMGNLKESQSEQDDLKKQMVEMNYTFENKMGENRMESIEQAEKSILTSKIEEINNKSEERMIEVDKKLDSKFGELQQNIMDLKKCFALQGRNNEAVKTGIQEVEE